jgi:hypothetical protein
VAKEFCLKNCVALSALVILEDAGYPGLQSLRSDFQPGL